jgi:hypothetical protein
MIHRRVIHHHKRKPTSLPQCVGRPILPPPRSQLYSYGRRRDLAAAIYKVLLLAWSISAIAASGLLPHTSWSSTGVQLNCSRLFKEVRFVSDSKGEEVRMDRILYSLGLGRLASTA